MQEMHLHHFGRQDGAEHPQQHLYLSSRLRGDVTAASVTSTEPLLSSW